MATASGSGATGTTAPTGGTTGTLHVDNKKKACASRKRYFLWIMGLFIAFVVESFVREMNGTGLYNGVEGAAENFKNLDFPAQLAEWWHYFTTMYIPAHIEFIKTGTKNLYYYVTGNPELTESVSRTTLENVVPMNLSNLIIDAGFVTKIAAIPATIKNFGQTVFRDVKQVFKRS